MKKQEIKQDLIRDRIVAAIQFLADNSKYVWIFLGVTALIIIFSTIFSNQTKDKLLNSNNSLGLLQNKLAYDSDINDSLIIKDFEILLNSSLSQESYNQALIHLLNNSIKINNKDKLIELLNNNKFKSDDDMLNSFILKVKGDIASDDNDLSSAMSYYHKAIDIVPSYDLMAGYSVILVDLYLEDSNLDGANKVFINLINQTEDVDNLPRDTKNNIDFIEYKLKQLNK